MEKKYHHLIIDIQDGIEGNPVIRDALASIYDNVYPEDRQQMHEIIAAILRKARI